MGVSSWIEQVARKRASGLSLKCSRLSVRSMSMTVSTDGGAYTLAARCQQWRTIVQ